MAETKAEPNEPNPSLYALVQKYCIVYNALNINYFATIN